MSGNFSSPGWPEEYENKVFCRYQFSAPKGMVIKVLRHLAISLVVNENLWESIFPEKLFSRFYVKHCKYCISVRCLKTSVN